MPSKRPYRCPTIGERLADKAAECQALRVELRLLTLALYREQRERRRLEDRLAQEADTVLEVPQS